MPRLDRPLAQQVGAEAMDRADVRFFEVLERALEARAPPPPMTRRRRAFSSSRRRRSFSSPAAFSVNVTATSRSIVVRPVASTRRMRLTSSVVLPVPAAASTTSVSSSACSI